MRVVSSNGSRTEGTEDTEGMTVGVLRRAVKRVGSEECDWSYQLEWFSHGGDGGCGGNDGWGAPEWLSDVLWVVVNSWAKSRLKTGSKPIDQSLKNPP
jgi:hypothetical protein